MLFNHEDIKKRKYEEYTEERGKDWPSCMYFPSEASILATSIFVSKHHIAHRITTRIIDTRLCRALHDPYHLYKLHRLLNGRQKP